GYEARLVSEVDARADGTVEEVVAAWREGKEGAARALRGKDFREIGVGVSLDSEAPLYVLVFALSWADFFRERTSALPNLEPMRVRMLERVNRERLARKLAPLRRHPRLDDAAQAHAEDLFARRYYSHDTSEGKTDRKSTRLNSSHEWISYAVFCLKKKKT